MASASEKESVEPVSPAAAAAEVITLDLPAPSGWKKKFFPKKPGTPRRGEITFISPTGEEIKSKKQLDQYLRSHTGNPPASEFDWGTGDTPRRSARISEKAKAIETPEAERPKKRERKSSSKKEATKDEKESGDGKDEAAGGEEDAAGADAKGIADVEMKDTKEEGAAKPATGDKTKENLEGKPDECLEKKEDSAETDKVDAVASLRETGKGEDNKPVDTEVLPAAGEPKLEASAEKEAKDGEVLSENGGRKDGQEGTATKEVLSMNCDDGQHPPKASPAVNC